jgi:hypothetical protein
MTTVNVISLLTILTAASCGRCQAGFTNLNFESAHLPFPPGPGGQTISVTDALPGWTVLLNSTEQGFVRYNEVSTGGTLMSLIDPYFALTSIGEVIDGSYSLLLFAGGGVSPGINASISQTGTVPTGSLSLRFVSYHDASSGGLSLYFGGTSLPFQPLGDVSDRYALYGADISAFAGLSGELTFKVQALPPYGTGSSILDNIQFVVPEPSVWGLTLSGGLGLWWIRKHRRGRS